MITDFGGFQEIVVSGWIQRQVLHPSRMHQHVVEVPKINIRLVLRQDFLHFSVESLANILIGLVAGIIDAGIEVWIGIESAIRALGRESVGVKGILKNVGVFISANPAQGIKLKSATCDVGKKSSKLKGANIERDANVPQLLLQDRRQKAGRLFRGCLHRQVKTQAVASGIPGGVQQLARFCWIVGVSCYVLVVSPALRWE